jgi:SAM-dependent methyltransferase
MRHALVKALGWKATILQGDPTVADRWRWLKKHLRTGPSVRTLDAGCGTGAYTIYTAMQGNQTVGISFDPGQLERAEARAAILGVKGIEFHVGDLRHLDELAPKLGTFDQVILFETIEHILNDQKLVTDCAALLRPGGDLLLTTPYKNHHGLWGEKLSETEDGGHVRWGYTHEDLTGIMNRAGLEVVAAEYVSGLVSQKLAGLQFGIGGLLNPHAGWGATFPLRVLHPLDSVLTKLTKYPHLSVGVVGRKPGAA